MATITMYNSINVDDAFSPVFAAVATGTNNANTAPDPAGTWTARTMPSNTSWNEVAFGGTNLVAVAGGGTSAATSPDGTTWTARTLSASATWQSVCYGNGVFIAVANGSTNTSVSTDDGITWSAGGALPSSANWYSIAYGVVNGTPTFVVVAQGTGVTAAAYSTNNGTSWSAATLPSGDWRSVCFGNGKFVTVSYNSSTAATSTNGTSWSSQTMFSSANWKSVSYGNGTYVAVAYNTNKASTSTDGIVWTDRTLSATANWNSVCYGVSSTQGYKVFMAVSYGATTGSYSYDNGATWVARALATSLNYQSVCFAPFPWNSGDTLVIQNNATITVNTNQTKFWKTVTGTYGKLEIVNDSTSAVNFYMGRNTGSTANAITPGSGLFTIDIQGDWLYLGIGDSTADQTIIIPYTEYVPFVEIETGEGTGIYEQWVNITGAIGPFNKIMGRDGLEWAGSGKRGNYFTQDAATNPISIVSLTSGVNTIQSRRVTCTSTSGVFPGASITGTGVPASTVVSKVINSTTLELNAVCTSTNSGLTFTIYNPITSQFSNTIRFGNGVNGNVIPFGANIRIPNIMVSDLSPANLITISNLLECNIVMATASPIYAEICMFGNAYLSMAQVSVVYFRHVGFAYRFALSECYNVDIDYCCICPGPTYWYYSAKWIMRDHRYSTVAPVGYTAPTGSNQIVWSYITGAKIKNLHCVTYSSAFFTGTTPLSMLDLSYSDNMEWENIRLVQLNCMRAVYVLNISNRCYRNSFTNLELYGTNPLVMATSDDNIFTGIEYSLSMFKEIKSYASLMRFGDDFENENELLDNTKYYAKTRTYFSWLDRSSAYYDSNEYSCTAFQSGWAFPDYLSVRPTESAANSVTIDWVRRAPESGTVLYEIYRDTTQGFTARNASNRVYGSATAATVTYADTGVTAGTRYYYRFRKYHYLQGKTNCSAGSGSTTLTTTGAFDTLFTISDVSFDNGSTTVKTLVNNFYSSMFYPGATVTGTGIDTNTTVVEIDPSGREMIISKPTLSAQTLITLTLPVQVGMGLNHANIPVGTTVQSIESTTSLTMTNATTGVITAATVNFQTFTESPEFTCVPRAYATATNYLLYSRDFSNAQWVKTNCTVGAATYVAVDTITATASIRSLTATSAGGNVANTVTGLTASTAYTASFWVRADQTATDPTGISGSFSFGTTTTNFTATNNFKLVTATYTTSGTSAAVTITITSNTKIIFAGDVMVNLGSTVAGACITTTSAAATLNPRSTPISTFYAWARNSTYTGMNKNQGIRPTIGTPPTGSYYTTIHLSDEAGFSPLNSNYVANTFSILAYHFSLTGCSRNTFTDIIKPPYSGAVSTSPIYLTTSSLDNNFIDCDIDMEYTNTIATALLNVGAACSNNFFHNIDFGRIRNYETGTSILYTQLTNSITGNLFQNIRSNNYDITISNQSLNSYVKGVASGSAVPATTSTTYALGSTSDGVAILHTASYGTMFYELYTSSTKGLIQIVFEDTLGTNKPYTILSGNPTFTNTGYLYMPGSNDSIEIVWPHKIYGVSGFRDLLPKLIGVDLGNIADQLDGLKIEYSINNAAYKRLTPANIKGETVSATTGFDIKFKFTTRPFMKYGTQTNPFVVDEVIRGSSSGAIATVIENYDNGTTGTIVLSNITGSFIPTESLVRNSDSQARAPNVATNGFALGPSFTSYIAVFQLFTNINQAIHYQGITKNLTLTGLKTGSEVRILENGTTTELGGTESSGTSYTYVYTYAPNTDVDIVIHHVDYIYYRINNYTLGSSDVSLPIDQQRDRQYKNP